MDDVEVHPLVLVSSLVALVGCFLLRRRMRARGIEGARASFGRTQGGAAIWVAMAGLLLLASGPLVWGLPRMLAADAMLPGDAPPHAFVAQQIARHGLERGWIDGYNGGFPFGPHYQSLAILVVAGLVRLGVPPTSATQGVGVVAVLLVPLLFLAVARLAGARPFPALLGALILAWPAHFQTFIGGPRVYLSQGLLSQAFAMPIVLLTACAVLTGRPRRGAPLLGALCIAAHAQVSLCAFAAAAPVMVLAADARMRRRFWLAAAGAVAAGAAIYGPGLRTFRVPFSWAKVPTFRVIGYGPERLPAWLLEGKLFDNGRTPAFTALLLVCALVLLLGMRARPARGALLLLVTSIGGAVSGQAMVDAGAWGASLVEIFSPVRMLCIIPLAAAAAVCVAVSKAGAWVVGWRESLRARLGVIEGALAALVALPAGPPIVSYLGERVRLEAKLRAQECAPIAGYRTTEVASWLRALPLDRGRVVVDGDSFHDFCPVRRGLELAVPLIPGAGLAGPGSQLGVLLLAFDEIHLSRAGGADRAESLGVRYTLHTRTHMPAPLERWRVVASRGDIALSERLGGTDRVGVGCVEARWSGADRALRDALFDDLSGEHPTTGSPHALTLLTAGEGTVIRSDVATGACDASSASVVETPREPGAFEATVTSAAPVDVIVRTTFVDAWSIRIDGVSTEPRRVAPGFPAVRVPAGVHRVDAVVAQVPGYSAGLLAALGVVMALTRADRTRRRGA